MHFKLNQWRIIYILQNQRELLIMQWVNHHCLYTYLHRQNRHRIKMSHRIPRWPITLPFKSLSYEDWSFLCFWKFLMLTKAACLLIWSKCSLKLSFCEILLQYKITVFYHNICLKSNLVLWWQSWISSIIAPVFSVTWFFRSHYICWFAAQEPFLIIINVEYISTVHAA